MKALEGLRLAWWRLRGYVPLETAGQMVLDGIKGSAAHEFVDIGGSYFRTWEWGVRSILELNPPPTIIRADGARLVIPATGRPPRLRERPYSDNSYLIRSRDGIVVARDPLIAVRDVRRAVRFLRDAI